jgi:hypothetical protein
MDNVANHAQLRQAYLDDLRWAKGEASEQYENRIRSIADERFEGDEARAREAVEQEQPPCTYRRVIGVIRKYWLACDRLNDSLPPLQRIPPLVFIFDSLANDAPDLYEFLSPMPFWPMGQDAAGRWI